MKLQVSICSISFCVLLIIGSCSCNYINNSYSCNSNIYEDDSTIGYHLYMTQYCLDTTINYPEIKYGYGNDTIKLFRKDGKIEFQFTNIQCDGIKEDSIFTFDRKVVGTFKVKYKSSSRNAKTTDEIGLNNLKYYLKNSVKFGDYFYLQSN